MICLTEVRRPGKCGKITVKTRIEGSRGRGSSENGCRITLEPLDPGILEPFLADDKMLKFEFVIRKDRTLTILCLGAHCDDIEIGCGGTILKLLKSYKNTIFHWIVFSSDSEREKEAIKSGNVFLKKAKEKKIMIKNFRNGFFPYLGKEIKGFFEELKREISPDLIFTHYRNDLHQDHHIISDLTWNTFRDHLILEYEIPKYDGDLGCPNFFVHLEESICNQKVKYILNYFQSQRENQWFSQETFLSVLRLRGLESNSPHKYAEAFYCRKIIAF
jgi:LmbE family N-acetylglucosaminyl deacetylase